VHRKPAFFASASLVHSAQVCFLVKIHLERDIAMRRSVSRFTPPGILSNVPSKSESTNMRRLAA
jgi:hypothetical protein